MLTKRLLLLGAALLLGALVNAASAEEPAAPAAAPAAPAAAPAGLFSAPTLAGPPMDPGRLLAAQATLGYGLIAKLAAEKGGGSNFVASPASLLSVFSFLDLGASPVMRKSLYKSLGFGKASDTAAADFDAVRGSVAAAGAGEGGPLSLANAIFIDPAVKPYKATVAGMAASGADVAIKELSKPEVIKEINDWVASETKGLIPSILDQPPQKPGLIALNALYFKDRWQTPFDPKETDTGKFQTVDERSLDVPMMHSPADELLFRQDDDFVAVDLPYATAGFSLVVVTTKDKPAPAKAFAKAASWLTGASFTMTKGELALPRFSLATTTDLLSPLQRLGLRRSSGFSALSPVKQVITQVLQKTVIKVDEEGTEAAAATAVTTDRSFTADFVKMTVDKPFLFALRDQKSGLVLLAGYVGDPTGGTAAEAKAQ
jgi:serpin B